MDVTATRRLNQAGINKARYDDKLAANIERDSLLHIARSYDTWHYFIGNEKKRMSLKRNNFYYNFKTSDKNCMSLVENNHFFSFPLKQCHASYDRAMRQRVSFDICYQFTIVSCRAYSRMVSTPVRCYIMPANLASFLVSICSHFPSSRFRERNTSLTMTRMASRFRCKVSNESVANLQVYRYHFFFCLQGS